MNPVSMQAFLTGVLAADFGDRDVTPEEFERLRAPFNWVWSDAQVDSAKELTGARRERLIEQVHKQVSAAAAASFEGIHNTANVPARDTTISGMDLLYAQLLDVITQQLDALPDKPEETPASTLRALWLLAAGQPVSAEVAVDAPLPALDVSAVAQLKKFLEFRRQGVPLAHLTGRQLFMGIELHVGKAALVPRKETEILGFSALGVLRCLAQGRPSPLVVDVCTGIGNIALALATYVSGARVYASDLSEEAVALARQNGDRQGVSERLEFRQGDFLMPFDSMQFHGQVDVLTCNPPYISSGKLGSMPDEIMRHEPRMAFDGGPFGIKILQRLISEAPRYVRTGGWLIFEVGEGQGPTILERLRRNPAYRNSHGARDASGRVRTVLTQVQGAVP